MMSRSIFTISLDFELHWGGFEKWPIDGYKDYFDKTREVIHQVLKAFERTEVHCSWATVGLLLHQTKKELISSIPKIKPTYTEHHLSAYKYIEEVGIGENEKEDPYHFADSLVRQIIDASGQELSSHSFAHFYCNEPGQTLQQFEADAKAWNRAAEKYGVTAKSLVFPRNQFNDNYLEVCRNVGIEIVRANPVDWWWQIDSTQNESGWKQLNRGLDAYVNLGGKTSFDLSKIDKKKGVWLLPASRLLRPFRPKELFLNDLKINRIKREMTIAAQNNECYHLWWHPHNFGRYTQQNMSGLVDILNHYQELNNEYGMQSLNMGEIVDQLNNA